MISCFNSQLAANYPVLILLHQSLILINSSSLKEEASLPQLRFLFKLNSLFIFLTYAKCYKLIRPVLPQYLNFLNHLMLKEKQNTFMPIVGQVFKWFPLVLNCMLIRKKPLKTNIICYRVHHYSVLWRRMASYLQFVLLLYYFLTIKSDALPKLNIFPTCVNICFVFYLLLSIPV